MITVRIPATCANLGPGFDCMGLALNLWNTFELHCTPVEPGAEAANILVESSGEGARSLPSDSTNLIAHTVLSELGRLHDERRAMNETIHQADHTSIPLPPSSYRIICHNDVPCASGLGSSSTAVLAGLIFAHSLCDIQLNLSTILTRATEIEGHGDNVAPALFGGLILVSYDGHTVVAAPVTIQPLRVVVCVPDFNYLTTTARATLPKSVSRSDAVFNVGRAMLIVEALRSGSDTLLARAMGDRLHEQYRLPVIPGARAARQRALDCGATAVCLSGAGPGLMAFARDHHASIGQAMRDTFIEAGVTARYWVLDSTDHGVEVHRT